MRNWTFDTRTYTFVSRAAMSYIALFRNADHLN